MLALVSLLAHPLGRAALLVTALSAALLAALGGLYLKGRADGRDACLVQGERDVREVVRRADKARAGADRRDADDRRLRDDDAFRRD